MNRKIPSITSPLRGGFSLAMSLGLLLAVAVWPASLAATPSRVPSPPPVAQPPTPALTPPPIPVMGPALPPGMPPLNLTKDPRSFPDVGPPADVKKGRVRILSDQARYDRRQKVAHASGHVKIYQEDTAIYTDAAQFSDASKMTTINGPVKVVQVEKPSQRKTVLTGNMLTAYHNEKRIVIDQNVRLDRESDPKPPPVKTEKGKKDKVERALKKERTVINSDQLTYWTQRKEAYFNGHVVMRQRDKKATGDRATMLDKEGTVTFEGNVELIQINGDWLVKEGIVTSDKPDAERDRTIKTKATMLSDRLVIDQKTNNATATGNVKLTQKGRTATGDQAVIDDIKQTITLSGKARLQKENGDWLTADRVVFHMDTENFEAFMGNQQVESESTTDENGNPIVTPSSQASPESTLPDFNLEDDPERQPLAFPSLSPPPSVGPQPLRSPGSSLLNMDGPPRSIRVPRRASPRPSPR